MTMKSVKRRIPESELVTVAVPSGASLSTNIFADATLSRSSVVLLAAISPSQSFARP